MALQTTHLSEGDAVADLVANGFEKREGYWTKRSKVDDWYGGYAVAAIVHIERRYVAAEYGGGDYYELRFA